VPIPIAVIGRLLDTYPQAVAGIKDSSGDWSHTETVIAAFAARGFDVFAGSEVFLLRALRAGGVGCITAGANVNPHGIAAVYRDWRSPEAPARQSAIDGVRRALQDTRGSMIAALKATIAHYARDPEWRTVRPPLVELPGDERAGLVGRLESAGFEMPGLRA